MARHLERRAPQKNGGFSWARLPLRGYIEYRLFRRDHTGALHMDRHVFALAESRNVISTTMRAARHDMRNRVDEIDLAAMFSTQEAA